MKLGAKDYLIKDLDRHYLGMLPIQIENIINNRNLEKERKWLSALFNSIAETIHFGMYLYEPLTEKVVYYNPSFLTIWDVPDELCTSGSKVTHSELWGGITGRDGYESTDLTVFPNCETDYTQFQSQGEIRLKGNKTIRFFTGRVLYEPGISPCFVSFFEDTSELSQAYESLYQYNLELESLNVTLDQRVQERTRMIELLMQKKNEMIINIGHDLRTPLTPLIGLLPHLRDMESDSEKQKILSIILDGAMKIHSLAESALKIGNLIDESTPEEKRSDESICNLRDIMIKVISRYLPDIEKKELQIVNITPDDVIFLFRPAHLRMILDNLVHNAIYYTNKRGSISLCGGIDEDSIWFCISDTGIGLTSYDTSRIFDDFYKVDSARNNLQTHGIGLSVVKKLVIMNNGHITVMSEGLGKGSKFCISFPGNSKNP